MLRLKQIVNKVHKMMKPLIYCIIFIDIITAICWAMLLDGFFKTNCAAKMYTNQRLPEDCSLDVEAFIVFLLANNTIFGIAGLFFFLGAFVAAFKLDTVVQDEPTRTSAHYCRLNFVIMYFALVPFALLMIPICFQNDFYIRSCGSSIIYLIVIYRFFVLLLILAYKKIPLNDENMNDLNSFELTAIQVK